jgi:putative transposase
MGHERRLQYPDALYHVTIRSNAAEVVMRDDWDFLALLTRLEETIERCRWNCLAYCVLNRHYHLSLETPQANVAQGMHLLNLAYARRFNRRYGRYGHVFQTPYRARLITTDEYLRTVLCYIALNPVVAGVCRTSEDWVWSSYAATIGLRCAPPWLATTRVLELFDRDPANARRKFRSLVNEKLDHLNETRAQQRLARAALLAPAP